MRNRHDKYGPAWADPEDCPHHGVFVCWKCDRGRGWYYRDNYPDCPWRVTTEETKREPKV